MNEFEAFESYLAVKTHFTSKTYDFTKFNGKIKSANRYTFDKRKDRGMFMQISRKFQTKSEFIKFLVANFTRRKIGWVGDLMTEEAEDAFNDWKKIFFSLTETFRDDMQKMSDHLLVIGKDFDHIFTIHNGMVPVITKFQEEGIISLESLIIILNSLDALEYLNKRIDDEYVWPDKYLLYQKYSLTFEVEKRVAKKIMKEVFVV